MGKFSKMTSKSGIVFFLALAFSSPARGEVLWNFDALPPTASDEITGSAGGHLYTPVDTNSHGNFSMAAYDLSGWRNTVGDPREASTKDDGSQHKISNNSSNIRFENVGYLEIDKTTAISENSQRYPITGGKNSETVRDRNTSPLHNIGEIL